MPPPGDDRLRSKFAGCLLGAFAGDALGMPVEGWPPDRIAAAAEMEDLRWAPATWPRVSSWIFRLLADPRHELASARLGRGAYTDDTQMTIAVAESLIERGGFDGAHLARRFVEVHEPCRGYGPGTRAAIARLREGVPWDRAGRGTVGGEGSFGNGAAMRAAPIGLFFAGDPAELRRAAELSAIITHSHPLGMEGAALQAFAVARALARDPAEPLDPAELIAELLAFVRPEHGVLLDRLRAAGGLLRTRPAPIEVARALGNDVTVPGSVPAAICAFLAHPGSFRDAVVFAVAVGGDTDTIASMAGAIAGAYRGIEDIPGEWLAGLENGPRGRDHVRDLAGRLLAGRRAGAGNRADAARAAGKEG